MSSESPCSINSPGAVVERILNRTVWSEWTSARDQRVKSSPKECVHGGIEGWLRGKRHAEDGKNTNCRVEDDWETKEAAEALLFTVHTSSAKYIVCYYSCSEICFLKRLNDDY